MPHWAMVIDLRKCIGCGTCTEVCKEVNEVPVGAVWRRLIEGESTIDRAGVRIFVTMSCMHCNAPPCLEVCPTGATHRRRDGIVQIDHQLCLGCGSCVVACPYMARSITYVDRMLSGDAVEPKAGNAERADRIGVCTKCSFCSSRVDMGLKRGLKPGIDPEATPLCVRFCIGKALTFGDLNDPNSEVSSLKNRHAALQLLEELGTRPSVYYIGHDNEDHPK